MIWEAMQYPYKNTCLYNNGYKLTSDTKLLSEYCLVNSVCCLVEDLLCAEWLLLLFLLLSLLLCLLLWLLLLWWWWRDLLLLLWWWGLGLELLLGLVSFSETLHMWRRNTAICMHIVSFCVGFLKMTVGLSYSKRNYISLIGFLYRRHRMKLLESL